MLQVNHTLNQGFGLQTDLSQKATTVTAWFPWAGPHLHHSSTSASWQTDRRLHSATVTSYLPAPDDATRGGRQPQTMSALPRKAPVQCDILIVFSCSHFFPISPFCFIAFLFLLPECTSRVPCHGNTCRWRQSSSSTSFASAEEVTNHSTSREVLSPRYPWTICKRGCPWSTRFSQVFSLLLRTSVKALFPLFAPHHVPCLRYFTQSCKLTA